MILSEWVEDDFIKAMRENFYALCNSWKKIIRQFFYVSEEFSLLMLFPRLNYVWVESGPGALTMFVACTIFMSKWLKRSANESQQFSVEFLRWKTPSYVQLLFTTQEFQKVAMSFFSSSIKFFPGSNSKTPELIKIYESLKTRITLFK